MLGVRPRATRLRQPGIGDVAHQRMLELVLGLAAERRGRPRHDEASILEPEQRGRRPAPRRARRQSGSCQNDAADDRRLLQHALVIGRQGRRCERRCTPCTVSGSADRGSVDRSPPSISLPDDRTRVDHPEHDLLEEEGIALGRAHDLAPQLVRKLDRAEQAVDERRPLRLGQRLKRDRRRALRPAAKLGRAWRRTPVERSRR